MISNKNKVIITVLSILGAIVFMVVMFNKVNVVKKVERFVDNENEDDDLEDEAEDATAGNGADDEDEENDDEEKESFADEPDAKDKQQAKDAKEPKMSKDSTDSKDMKEPKDVKEKKDAPQTSSPNSRTIVGNDKESQSALASKLKSFIDTLDNELRNKNVSEDIKTKVMTDLMQNIGSLQSMGVSASKAVATAVEKYAPQKSTYIDAPMKSMDSVKMHLRAALQELESTSSRTKEEFNERFSPSREAPKAPAVPPMMGSHSNSNDTIEGFENAPRYALY